MGFRVPNPSSLTDPAERVRWQSLERFLLNPVFDNGVEVGDGSGGTNDGAAGTKVPPSTVLLGPAAASAGGPPDSGHAPVAPVGVAVTAGVRSVFVSWTANTEVDMVDFYGTYEMQWSLSASMSSPTAVSTGSTFATVVGFVSAVPVYVRVRAVDASGRTGVWSAVVSATPLLIGTVDIGDAAVAATKIADGSITTPKLTTGAVTADKIAANTITAGKIAANTITAGQLAANSIVAGKIAAGAIDGTTINSVTLNSGTVTSSVYRTAASGPRIEFQPQFYDPTFGYLAAMLMYDSVKTYPAKIYSQTAVGNLELRSSANTVGNEGGITLSEGYVRLAPWVHVQGNLQMGDDAPRVQIARFHGNLGTYPDSSGNATIYHGLGDVPFYLCTSLVASAGAWQDGYSLAFKTAYNASTITITGNNLIPNLSYRVTVMYGVAGSAF